MENIIGNSIKKLGMEAGLSKEDIAGYLSVNEDFISLIENGQDKLSLSILDSLAALFGCKTAVIMNGSAGGWKSAVYVQKLNTESLHAIAAINKIALNQLQMKQICKAEGGR